MKIVKRVVLGLLLATAATRMLLYFCYALDITIPYEAFHLESKMILLAYRVQAGDTLYPDWQHYPHVANFFGPVYFVVVGLIGRLVHADLTGLVVIGRAVTFSAALITTMLVAVHVKRTCGWWAAVAAGMVTLGVSPLYGFSVMARADLLAETIGTAGFLLAIQKGPRLRYLGCVVLALAVLTKQTSAVFMLGAALAHFFDGARREALTVFVTTSGLVVLAIVLITALREPRFATDFLGEGKTPWLFPAWLQQFKRILVAAPDLLAIPFMTLLLVRLRGGREPALLGLTLVVATSCLVLSAKRGADLNYYLNLRVCEGLAMGILCKYALTATATKWDLSLSNLGVLVAAGCLVPGTAFAVIPAHSAWQKYEFRRTSSFRSLVRTHDRLFEMAENPKIRLLTDSGLIDLHQRERAAFGDQWLFRMLVETGRIEPTKMKEWIEAEDYDIIVTTSDLLLPGYKTYEFGLPMVLVESIKKHYVSAGTLNSFFIYNRKGAARASLPNGIGSTAPRVP